jgi:hypothetical protein
VEDPLKKRINASPPYFKCGPLQLVTLKTPAKGIRLKSVSKMTANNDAELAY